jgi:hypothetical protein
MTEPASATIAEHWKTIQAQVQSLAKKAQDAKVRTQSQKSNEQKR